MNAMDALTHLRDRLRAIDGAESRHRPHWTQKDLEAVERLLERPAAAEQIALARIEGLSHIDTYADSQDRLRKVNAISKRALNIGVAPVQTLTAAPIERKTA